MIEKIVDILHSKDGISGWQVREVRRQSRQLFLNRSSEESRRMVESLHYEVELLVDHFRKREGPREKVTGQSRFVVDASAFARFEEDLKQAAFAAGLVDNEAFRLPDPGPFYPTPPLSDPVLEKNPEKELASLAGRLEDSVPSFPGCRLAAAEFFALTERIRHFNSQGIQSAQESTMLSAEFALVSGPKGREKESFRFLQRRRCQDFKVEEEAAYAARLAGMKAEARPPRTGKADVIFCEESLDHLFDWFTTQASAAAKYNRLVSSAPDQVLAAARPGCTPLTLWHNAALPWMAGSYCFDTWGVAARRLMLVDKGVLRNYWAGPRHAQYLKIPASGELGNLEVECGQASEAGLLKPSGGRPLVQVFEFSYFEPNPVTGEFSGEIRSGIEFTASGSRPIQGGSVSGNTKEAFEGAVFSKEACARERYVGPKMIRCEGLTIAGE